LLILSKKDFEIQNNRNLLNTDLQDKLTLFEINVIVLGDKVDISNGVNAEKSGFKYSVDLHPDKGSNLRNPQNLQL